MNAPMKERRLARRIFRGFVKPAMLGALGIAALLVSLWLEHRTEITLPTPTGHLRSAARSMIGVTM